MGQTVADRAPKDQRTASTYIFAPSVPSKQGGRRASALQYRAMNLHLRRLP